MEREKNDNLTSREIALFRIGAIICGVDTVHIREINRILEITRVYPASDFVRGVVNLRGEIVTMIDLHAPFSLPVREDFIGMNNIVIRYKDENIGILVDNVIDVIVVEDVEISVPPAHIEGITGRFFSGIYKLEEDLVAILNIKEIVTVDKKLLSAG